MEIKEPVSLGYSSAIHADATGWSLRFVLPGPDLRYKFEFLTIKSHEVKSFRQAFIDAMARYAIIKPSLRGGAEVVEQFGRVTMRAGGYLDALCLGSYRVVVKSAASLNDFLNVLDGIPERGDELVSGIRALSTQSRRPLLG